LGRSSVKRSKQGTVMVARNDITGDSIQTKSATNKYRDNYDLIFGKKQDNTGTDKNDYQDVLSTEDCLDKE
jgi:hypothetical protein